MVEAKDQRVLTKGTDRTSPKMQKQRKTLGNYQR